MNILKEQRKKLIVLIGTFLLVMATGFTCVYMNRASADTNDETISSIEDTLKKSGYNNIPLTVEELKNNNKTSYSINSNNDWLAFMVISSKNSLDGYTFNLQNITDGGQDKTTYELKNTNFKGISCKSEYPFQGTLNVSVELTLQLDVPLFENFDASKGRITGSTLSISTENATSGLIQNLTYKENEEIDLSNIINNSINLDGTVKNENGPSGGIIGCIDNKGGRITVPIDFFDKKVTTYKNTKSIKSVTGKEAGQIFGQVKGNVYIDVEAGNVGNVCTVKGTGSDSKAGYLIGELVGEKAVFNLKNISGSGTSPVSYNVSEAEIAGGVIGSIDNASVTFETKGTGTSNSVTMKNTINTTNTDERTCYAGGFIGSAKKSVITFSGDELNATMSLNVLNDNDNVQENAAGGIIGKVEDSIFALNTKVIMTTGTATSLACGDYVGGLFGYMSNGTFASTVDYSYTTNAKGEYAGGFAGYLDSMQINMSGTVTAKATLKGNYAGGFAGNITRTLENGEGVDTKKFLAKNIIFTTDISQEGKYTGVATGGLFGKSSNQYFEISSAKLSGDLSIINNAMYSGGIFGHDDGSTILEDLGKDSGHYYVIKGNSETIQSSNTDCNLGGFAGYFKNTKLINQITTYTDKGDFAIDISCNKRINIKATSTNAKSQSVSGGIGTYYTDKKITSKILRMSVYLINLDIADTNCETYSGVLVGQILEAENVSSDIIIENSAAQEIIAGNDNANQYFGGIIGFNEGKNVTVNYSYVNFKGQGNSDAKVGKCNVAGGYVGKTIGNVTVKDCTVQIDSKNINAVTFGGVVGQIGTKDENSVVVVDGFGYRNNRDNASSTVLDSSANNTDAIWGGIAGHVNKGSVLELDSTIDQNTNVNVLDVDTQFKYFGNIVGYNDNALIYINPKSYSSTTGYVYYYKPTTNRLRDEIGNYGSVYRNGNLDSTPASDMSDKNNWVIKRDGYKVTIKGDDNPTELATAGDIMRLSIALNTENAFSGFNIETYTTDKLLNGNYTVTSDIDISNAGIISVNKNDIESTDKDYAFKGTITGTGTTKPTIKDSITAFYQPNVGLFSTVDGATFSNFGVNMTVSYPYATTTSVSMNLIGDKQNAGGLAAIAKGNITVSNVDVSIRVSENEYPMGDENDNSASNHDFDNHCYGGTFGKYIYAKNGELNFDNVSVTTDFEVAETAHMFGGLVGYADISALEAKNDATLTLKSIETSGKMKSKFADKKQNNQDKIDKVRFGGVIAQIGEDSGDTVTGKLQINADGITVNGMQVSDETPTSNNNRDNVADLGGFIGYRWNNVNADIKNTVVENGDNTFKTTTRTSGASYGGLWNTVCGYMALETVNIKSFSASIQNASGNNKNGLLIGDGTCLYLDMGKDYDTDSSNKTAINYQVDGVTINDTASESFDEIVGHNKEYETNNQNKNVVTDELYGGIVSINRYDSTGTYHLYKNKAITQNNSNTRYFYNLYSTLSEDSIYKDEELNDNQNVEIGTTSKMMQWMLAHYAQVNLRQFFNINAGYVCKAEHIRFTKDIDLKNASYYPVNVYGATYDGTGKTITLHGADFDNYVGTESETLRFIKRSNSENYMLHGGIFNKVIESTISNFTLSGTVTSHGDGADTYSGALVAGEVVGVLKTVGAPNEYYGTPTYINNIVLKGISVSDKDVNNWSSNCGLAIAKVSSGATLNIGLSASTIGVSDEDLTTKGENSAEGIRMSGYDGNYSDTNRVASSLIGKVGSASEEGINITFYNMNIPDKNTNNPLAKSLFIYSYNYKYDNSGVIYIFYKKDYMKNNNIVNVTLGSEIADTVEFYNPDLSKPISKFTESEVGYVYNMDDYMPYVFSKDKAISVNPKTGDIVEGHGTYDDPYIIDSARQLVTLFKYLQSYKNNEGYLNGWAVNQYGKDVLNSDKNAVVQERSNNDKHYFNIKEKTYEELTASGFPTVENLSNAYYLITKDIDLSSAEYSGLGTSEIPFTGVFIGRKLDGSGNEVDNEKCVIDMPASMSETGETDYGFIKYAKGAVVENLTFSLGREASDSEEAKNVIISDEVDNKQSNAAAVFARIMGGDNQISNVTVAGTISTYNNNNTANIGGYVGILRFGTLIISNFEDDSVKDFKINASSSFMNGLVGRIQDGFVIDDTTEGTVSEKYTNDSGLKATDTTDTVPYDTTRTFDGKSITDSIVSRKNALDSDKKITVTKDITNGFSYTLNNTQNLMALTIALNSGAMNYYGNKPNTATGATSGSNGNTKNGYDPYSRCRIADYSHVGKCTTDSAKKQYASVILHDNMQNYYNDGDTTYSNPVDFSGGKTQSSTFYTPYIFKFFDFGDSRIMYNNSTDKGTLNRMENDSNDSWASGYKLAEGTYDLSAYWFKKCFKGIGARYNNTDLYSLQGSFVGSGKDNTTIKYDMDISDSQYASLFTVFYSSRNDYARENTYSDLKIICNVSNVKTNGERAAAGFVSYVYGVNKHIFNNLAIAGESNDKKSTITSNQTNDSTAKTTDYKMAAGIVVSPEKRNSTEKYNDITMTNCELNNVKVTATDDCGGFIAVDETNTNTIVFKSCQVKNSEIQGYSTAVGGFIGSTIAPITVTGTADSNSAVLSSKITTTYGSAGGMIGRISKREGGEEGKVSAQVRFEYSKIGKDGQNGANTVVSSLYDGNIQYVVNGYHTGGFVGNANVVKKNNVWYDIPFNNCNIDGLEINVNSGRSYAGGFIGRCNHGMYVNLKTESGNAPVFENENNKKTVINNLIINKKNTTYTEDAVGGMIGYGSSLNIGNVTVENMNINAQNVKNIGGIVGVANEYNLNINNVKIGNSDTKEIKLDGGIDSAPGNQDINVGGIIGSYDRGQSANNTLITNSSIGDKNNSDKISLINGKNVGGAFGIVKSAGSRDSRWNIGVNSFSVYNILLKTNNVEGGKAPVSFAGGIVGKIDDGNMNKSFIVHNATIENITIGSDTKNELTTDNLYANAAGGIVGYSNRKIDIVETSLSGLKIGTDNRSLYSGGLVGHLSGNGSLVFNDSVSIADSVIQGGVAGGTVGMYNPAQITEVKDVSVNKTTILAKITKHNDYGLSAGGLVGAYDTGTVLSAVNFKISKSIVSSYHYKDNCNNPLEVQRIGGLIGYIPSGDGKSKFYNITIDDTIIAGLKNDEESASIIPTYDAFTNKTDSIKLYTTCFIRSEPEQVELGSVEQLNNKYTYLTGTFVGQKSENSKADIIKANIHYSNENYHCVSDIGATNSEVYNSQNMKYIYNTYRKKYRIIYRDIQNTEDGNNLNTNEIIPTALKAGGENITDYYFADLERVLSDNAVTVDKDYTSYGTGANNSNYRLEENYGYSDTKFNSIIEKDYKNNDGYLSPFSKDGKSIPMITITNNEYSLTTIMNTVLNLLTNNGGGTENNSDITSVDFIRMKVEDGNVSKDDSEQILEYASETGKFSIKSAQYDTTENNSGTFTVCKVNYKYNDNNVYSVYIPVCIKELIGVQSHLRGVGGSYYKYGDNVNVKKDEQGTIDDKIIDTIRVEHKSTFTLYSEFSYDKVRSRYSEVKLNKTLYQTTTEGVFVPFEKGTRFTLIDVRNGNKVYYYTVKDNNKASISFNEFSDESGKNRYQTNNINDDKFKVSSESNICIGSKYNTEEDAIEQFIIIVDKSNISEPVNSYRNIYVRALKNDNELYDNISYNPECYANVAEFAGLKNYISGSKEYKNVEDIISNDENMKNGKNETTLNQDSQISHKGKVEINGSTFVVNTKTIDDTQLSYWSFSHPQPKYLDLGITIKDGEGKSINIPAGTKVTVNLKVPQQDGTKKDVSYTYYANGNTPYVYLFKDYKDKAAGEAFNMNSLKANAYIDFDVSLDFETASDLSKVENRDYHASLELLGTSDPDYPRSGETFDSLDLYTIKGVTKSNLGFAVETEDMLTQGMNGYNSESSDSGLVQFKTRLDFSEFINISSEGKKELNIQFNQYNNKWFKYTFKVQYKGTDKEYHDYKNVNSFIKIGSEHKSIEDMSKLSENTVTRTVQYSSEQVLAQKDGIFELPFTLYADRDSLLASDDTTTNFKVTCTVTVYDSDPDVENANPTVIDTLSDYFVFTVAKVKTDME